MLKNLPSIVFTILMFLSLFVVLVFVYMEPRIVSIAELPSFILEGSHSFWLSDSMPKNVAASSWILMPFAVLYLVFLFVGNTNLKFVLPSQLSYYLILIYLAFTLASYSMWFLSILILTNFISFTTKNPIAFWFTSVAQMLFILLITFSFELSVFADIGLASACMISMLIRAHLPHFDFAQFCKEN